MKKWPMTPETFDEIAARFLGYFESPIEEYKNGDLYCLFSISQLVKNLSLRALEARGHDFSLALEVSTPESRIVSPSLLEGGYGLEPEHSWPLDDEMIDDWLAEIITKPMRDMGDREIFDLMSIADELMNLAAVKLDQMGSLHRENGRPVLLYVIPPHRHVDTFLDVHN